MLLQENRAQSVGTFGSLPFNQATSSHPDSFVFDRFGNTYDIPSLSGASGLMSVVPTCGNFSILIEPDDNIPTAIQTVICQVFEDLSEVIRFRSQDPECEDIIEEHVAIEVDIELTGSNDLVSAGGYYRFLRDNNGCRAMLSNNVFRQINGAFVRSNPYPPAPAGRISLNLNPPDPWYTGTGNVPANQFDLYSAVLTEAMHLLGIESMYFNNIFGTADFTHYDRFIHQATNYSPSNPFLFTSPIIISDCATNCWIDNMTNPNTVEALATNNCTNFFQELVFGDDALAPLAGGFGAAPTNMAEQHAMLEHLNPSCNGFTEDYVSQTTLPMGVARRTLTDTELRILCRLGYDIPSTDDCENCVVVAQDDQRPNSSPNNAECCAEIITLCTERTTTISFDQLLCNDHADRQSLTITDVWWEDNTNRGNIVLDQVSRTIELTPDPNLWDDGVALNYTVQGCNCMMSNAFVNVDIFPCVEQEAELCNLSYYDDFEEFASFRLLGLPDDELFLFNFSAPQSAGGAQNTCDICNTVNNGNLLAMALRNPIDEYAEGLHIPLRATIDPGCTYTISLDVGTWHLQNTLSIIGSEHRPCFPQEARLTWPHVGCPGMVPVDCGSHTYDPFCIVEDQVITSQLQFEIPHPNTPLINWCPAFSNLQTLTLGPFTAGTAPINHLIITGLAPGATTSREQVIVIDNIEVTRDCMDMNAGFTAQVTGCAVQFTPDQIVNGVTHSWDFGDGMTSNEVSPNYAYPGNGTYQVTHTIMDECGDPVSSVQSVVITNCIERLCMCENGLNIGAPGETTRLSNINLSGTIWTGCVSLAGTIIVDNDIVFTHDVILDPDCEIIVESGSTLVGLTAHFFPCQGFWEGITAESGASVRMIWSDVERARRAVYAMDLSNVELRNTRFVDNWLAVDLEDEVNLLHTGIIRNRFRATGLTAADLPNQGNTYPIGIRTNNCPFVDISESIFEDLRTGILAEGSVLRITASTIRDIEIGVDLEDCISSSILSSDFLNCGLGIQVRNSDIAIVDNTITHSTANFLGSGIWMRNMQGRTSQVEGNTIDMNWNNTTNEFALVLNSPGLPSDVVIRNNTISDGIVQLSAVGYKFEENTIQGGTHVRPDVYVTNSSEASIYDNRFITGSVPSILMYVGNSDNNQIRDNVFDGFGNTSSSTIGMMIDNSGRNLYCCNDFNQDFGSNILVRNACGDTDLKTTTFSNASTALNYLEDAFTGPQIHKTNDWSQSFQRDALHQSMVQSFVSLSEYVDNTIPNNVDPPYWFVTETGPILNCTIDADCGEDLWSVGDPSTSDELVAQGDLHGISGVEAVAWTEDLRLMRKINRHPTSFQGEDFLSFQNTYHNHEIGRLAQWTQDFESTFASDFHSTYLKSMNAAMHAEVATMDELAQAIAQATTPADSIALEANRRVVLHRLDVLHGQAQLHVTQMEDHVQGQLQSLSDKLAELSTSSAMGSTYRAVMMLYVDYVMQNHTFSPQQEAALWQQATKCYDDHATGVLIARGLYDMATQSSMDWTVYDVCTPESREAGSLTRTDPVELMVSPLPFSDHVVLHASRVADQPADLNIFKVNGVLMHSIPWGGRSLQLTTSDWPSGMYIVQWEVDGLIVTQKIVKQQ